MSVACHLPGDCAVLAPDHWGLPVESPHQLATHAGEERAETQFQKPSQPTPYAAGRLKAPWPAVKLSETESKPTHTYDRASSSARPMRGLTSYSHKTGDHPTPD
eukprot:6492112-Amphidinium_carterae.3